MNIVKALLGYTSQRFMAAVGFPDISTTSGTGWGFLNRTSFNYQSARPEANSIVEACVRWAQRNFRGAPPILESWNDQRKDYDQHQHDDFLSLLRRPNPYYTGTTLFRATVADYMLNGDAYWVKRRSTTQRVLQYWWAPSSLMEPRGLSGDDTVFIDHYDYSPSGRPIRLEPEDVIHFQDGIDPTNSRKGLSPMMSLFREILTDDEAANMTAALLINLGVPGVIISPEHGTIGPEAAEKIKEMYQAKFTGDKRGEALVMAGQTKIQQFGWSPEQMQLRNLRGIPEERVTAVLGINSAVIGLGAGLSTTKVGATLKEYREEAVESFMVPLWEDMMTTLTDQALIPDFRSEQSGWRVVFDLAKVRVLQEDEHRRTEHLIKLLDSGGISVAEFRRALGMVALPEHELYLRKNGVTPVPAGLSPEDQAKIAKESTSTGAGRPLEGSVAAREAINKVEELLNL